MTKLEYAKLVVWLIIALTATLGGSLMVALALTGYWGTMGL
jgi:hypothetical protein